MKLLIPTSKLKLLRTVAGWHSQSSPHGWLRHIENHFGAVASTTGGGKSLAYWLEFPSDEDAVEFRFRYL